ncbi:ribonuclease H-like domain-containing protein [Tanacetum coccineum]
MLTSFSNPSMYKSVFVGNGQPIPVTHTGHSLLHTLHKPLHLHHVLVTPNIIKNLISVRQFTRDNNVSVDFDAYGFSVKDYQTRRLLLRCDSTGDLYPVTQQPSTTSTFALLLTLKSLYRILRCFTVEFAMTDLGSLNFFLGISAQRSSSGLFLSQSKFAAEEILSESAHATLQPLAQFVPDFHTPVISYAVATDSCLLPLLTASTDADWAWMPCDSSFTLVIVCSLVITCGSLVCKSDWLLILASAEAEYRRRVANVVAETALGL